MGRPQQIFCAIATFPHFAQRNPAIGPSGALGYRRSMIVAMPWPKPMHMVCRP